MEEGHPNVPKVFFFFVFGEQKAEIINHLFLHCKVVSQLWNLFISFGGIRWTIPGRAG